MPIRTHTYDGLPHLREDLHDLSNALAPIFGALGVLARAPELSVSSRSLIRVALDGTDEAAEILVRLKRTAPGVNQARFV